MMVDVLRGVELETREFGFILDDDLLDYLMEDGQVPAGKPGAILQKTIIIIIIMCVHP